MPTSHFPKPMNTIPTRLVGPWLALAARLGSPALPEQCQAAASRYEARLAATDAGVILRHGDGPDHCDTNGMREPSIVQEDGTFYTRMLPVPHTDATWVYWSTDPNLPLSPERVRLQALPPSEDDDVGTALGDWIWHPLAIEVRNGGGPGGAIAGLTAWLPDGRTLKSGTSGAWRCGQSGGESWFAQDAPADWPAVQVLGTASASPWNLVPPGTEGLPAALAASVPTLSTARPNAVLGGGFESVPRQWTVTGGDRIAHDWSRFPRDLWMGDYYLWLLGPNGRAEQTTALLARPGDLCQVTAEVGYSAKARHKPGVRAQPSLWLWPDSASAMVELQVQSSRLSVSPEQPPVQLNLGRARGTEVVAGAPTRQPRGGTRQYPQPVTRMPVLRPALACLVAASLCLLVGSGLQPVCAAESPPGPKPHWGERVAATYDQIRAGFADPPMAYAPCMFWFWDTPLTPAAKALAVALAGKVSQQRINPGYPNAIPLPWAAVPPEQWLSTDWFEALDGSLKSAERVGTFMGFCDEYGFPGGQAAGRVLAQHPELKAESLQWTIQDVAGGTTVALPAALFAVAARVVQRLEPAAATPPIGPWIWHPTANGNNQTVYFRTRLELDPARPIRYLDLNLTADDGWTLYVNGRQIASDGLWQRISQYDLRPYVHPGANTIAIEARNGLIPCGLTAGIHTLHEDGTAAHPFSGADWLTSAPAVPGWFEPAFDDRAWEQSAVVAPAGAPPWNKTFYQPERPAEIDAASLQVIGEGKPMAWTAPLGNWRIYSFNTFHLTWSGSPVNYLDERLPGIFMEIAYEPYAKHFGERLGRTLAGAFRDNEGAYGYKLAWSESLARRYQKDKGQDIRRLMPLLIDQDSTGRWAKARWDWFDCVSSLYADGYWQKSTDWLSRHGLYCTGHPWEETLMLQAAAVGDHFRMQRALSFQGVDSLNRNWLSSHDFREAQSVSEFENRRFMSETLGVSGWDMSPTLMKRAVNCTTAWGVSQFMAHINLLSRNLKALGWPPDWYSENPYFPYLHQWADFTRRASYVTAHGHTVPEVLLLNPMDSVWVLSGDGLFDPKVPLDLLSLNGDFGADVLRMDIVYADAMAQLTEARVEFLCADNYYLRKLALAAGKLVNGDFSFRSVVMPPMLVLPLDVAAKLVAFVQAGGYVYALGELPSCSPENGANDPILVQAMGSLRSQPTFVQCRAGLVPENAKADGGLRSAITFEAGDFPMIQQHRRIDGRDFFWLVNNTDDLREFRTMVKGAKGAAALWDCETGGIRAIASEETLQGSRVALALTANEACWLVFDPQQPAPQPTGAPPLQAVGRPLNGPWTWRIEPAAQPPLPNPVALPADLTAVPGVVRELVSWNQCGLGTFSGYADYSTAFEIEPGQASVRLELGRVQHLAEVWVNDRSVGVRLWAPYDFDLTQAGKRPFGVGAGCQYRAQAGKRPFGVGAGCQYRAQAGKRTFGVGAGCQYRAQAGKRPFGVGGGCQYRALRNRRVPRRGPGTGTPGLRGRGGPGTGTPGLRGPARRAARRSRRPAGLRPEQD